MSGMKNIVVIALSISLLSYSCVSFEKITLDGVVDANDTIKNNVSVQESQAALTANQGKLNSTFTSTDGIDIKNGEIVTLNYPGGSKLIASQQFNPLDFRGDLAIRIKAKSTGEKLPKLQLTLEDANGYQTNTIKLVNEIASGEFYQTYYYDLKGAYSQSYPEMRDVDAKNIVKLNLRLNNKYAGTVSIESIDVILSNEIIKQKNNVPVGKDGGMLADFTTIGSDWEISKGLTITAENGIATIKAENVGALYERIEIPVEVTNVLGNQTASVKVKVTSAQVAKLRLDLVDANGIITNKRPLIKEVKAGDWVEVEFDYTKRLAQSYPQQVELDGSRIVKAILYINAGDDMFNGEVLLDEIIMK